LPQSTGHQMMVNFRLVISICRCLLVYIGLLG